MENLLVMRVECQGVGVVELLRARGVVLAGGTSRRMGRNKAFLRHPEGGTFLERALRLFEQIGLPAVISGQLKQFEHSHVPQIPDGSEAQGPLGGMLSAMAHYPNDTLLICAVDVPALSADACLRLLRSPLAPGQTGRCLVCPKEGDAHRFFPFPLLLTPQCRPLLQQTFDAGGRALMPAVAALGLEELEISAETAEQLISTNTPESLKHYYDSVSPK